MPLYIGHYKGLKGPIAEAVGEETKKSLLVQDTHKVKVLKTWLNEEEGEVYYLFESPDKKVAEDVYREAHGNNMVDGIVEVKDTQQRSILKRFLGTVEQALIPNRASQIWAIRFVIALTTVILVLVLVGIYGPVTTLSVQDVAAFLSALAWPIIVLVVVLLFRPPLHSFLEHLAKSVRLNTVKIKLWALELEMPVEQASPILNKMQEEIIDTLGRLTDIDVQLFERIAKENGSANLNSTVDDLSNGPFEREDSPEHEQLRNLRDWRLIEAYTAERKPGGSWKANKYPLLTDFGLLALSLYKQDKTGKDSR